MRAAWTLKPRAPASGGDSQPHLGARALVTSPAPRGRPFTEIGVYSRNLAQPHRQTISFKSPSSSGTCSSNRRTTLPLGPSSSFVRRSFSFSRCGRPEMQEPAPGTLNDCASKEQDHTLSNGHASLHDTSLLLYNSVTSFLESEPPNELLGAVQRQTKISLSVLKEALDRYGLEHLALSYNGGKDCLVLLVLWLVTLYRHYGLGQGATSALSVTANAARHREEFPEAVDAVYIQSPNSFKEVDDFVNSSSQQYHLDLCSLTKPMQTALEDYLNKKPNVEAIFVGTRRTDPHGEVLTHFNETDGSWPRFMRCHPVIDWHYREIWGFIQHFDISYCSLYDKGFTSLGGTEDTFPNPRLKIEGADGEEARYRPAFELTEDDEERLGRYKP